MKVRYKIVGTQIVADYVKLTLQQNEAVGEKNVFDPTEMVTGKGIDFQGMLNKTQNMVMKTSNLDTVTIPYEEWEKFEYKIGDIVTVELKSEKV